MQEVAGICIYTNTRLALDVAISNSCVDIILSDVTVAAAKTITIPVAEMASLSSTAISFSCIRCVLESTANIYLNSGTGTYTAYTAPSVTVSFGRGAAC